MPLYGFAVYGTNRYATGLPHWTVPTGGYDSMDRLHQYADRNSNITTLEYDNEGRQSQIQYANGTITQATYDIVGRLLQLSTDLGGGSSLLNLTYGYNSASERIGQYSNIDSYDYDIDDSGRVVAETINRIARNRKPHFLQGDYSQCVWNDTTQQMELLPFNDSFDGNTLNLDRWSLRPENSYDPVSSEYNQLGLEIHQNQGLHMLSPRGWCDRSYVGPGAMDPILYDPYTATNISANLNHRSQLIGDFDIQISFSDYQIFNDSSSVFLGISDPNLADALPQITVARSDNSKYRITLTTTSGLSYTDTTEVDPNLLSGGLRITRTGTTITCYYYQNSTSSWVIPGGGTYTSYASGPLQLKIGIYTGISMVNVRFFNFQNTNPEAPNYPTSGTYQSGIYDAGKTVSLNQLSWAQALPSGTGLQFQIAVSDTPDGAWNYVGPDGTSGTHWSSSPAVLPTSPALSGRYIRHQVTMTSTSGTATPGFTDVQISFTAAGANTSTLSTYQYDPAGNFTDRDLGGHYAEFSARDSIFKPF